jgi:hypothetical protein
MVSETTTAQATRCARCKRSLTNPKAIAAGMGATCARKAATAAAAAEYQAQQADEAQAAPVVLVPAIAAELPRVAYVIAAGVEVRVSGANFPPMLPYVRRMTTRVNTFTGDDLVDANPNGWYVFRLQPNRAGFDTIRVFPGDVQVAA